jgi:hypothetical protein
MGVARRFHGASASQANPIPRIMLTSNINGVLLHVPEQYAGIVPVSPCDARHAFEVPCYAALAACCEPGMTVCDIGASVVCVKFCKMGSWFDGLESQ